MTAELTDRRGRYLKGPLAPFATARDRKELVGKTIRYLRDCDIDRTGRGYFFPRIDDVVGTARSQILLGNGTSIYRSEIVEIEIVAHRKDAT